MNVKFKIYGYDREMTLEKALQYGDRHWRDGVAESAQAKANDCAEQIARLLAHLVETNVIEIEAAFSIAGVYVENLEVVDNGP